MNSEPSNVVKFYNGEQIPLELHKVRVVQKLHLVPVERRLEAAREAGFNTFQLSTNDVYLDMLTDSGVNAMSDNQIAAMFRADDAYAGSQSFDRLKQAVRDVFGKEYLLPAHQGRACENIIARTFVKPGDVVPMNYHFTTTHAHIDLNGGKIEELVADEAVNPVSTNPFKGNLDPGKLRDCIARHGAGKIPFVRMEASTNLIGGQPFSIANMREIRGICDEFGIMLVLDASLIGENAYFIKMNEEGYADKSIAEIATEMFSYCDAFTMSAKKDGHANMGGMLAFRDKGLFWKNFSDFNEDGTVKTDVGVLLKVKQISCYGNDSYGGMSGRDIMALAVGLYESCDFNYMNERVAQCNYLAEGFYDAGVKGVVLPAGGHAVYINMDEFFDGKRGHDTFAGEGFSLELIRRYGIRVSELGDYSMEYDLKTPEQQAEVCNVVRFAIDRSRLTKEHLDYVIAAVKALYEDRENIPNMRIVWGHNLPMRHFHAFLEPYPNEEK